MLTNDKEVIENLLDYYHDIKSKRNEYCSPEDKMNYSVVFDALKVVLRQYMCKSEYDECMQNELSESLPIELMDIETLTTAHSTLNTLHQSEIINDESGQLKIRCELLSRSKQALVDYILGESYD